MGKEVTVKLSVADGFSNQLRAFSGGLEKADQSSSKMRAGLTGMNSKLEANQSQFMSSYGTVLTYAGAGLGALSAATAYAVQQAMQQEQATAQTEAVIKSTGGTAGKTAADIEHLAGQLSGLSGVQDDVIQSGANMLLTFKEVKGDTFDRASKAILDMAVAMNKGSLEGIDLQSTSIQVGKALNVAAGDVSGASSALGALTRVGVSFTDSQKEAAVAAIKMGDTMAFQTIVLKELESEFGGAAEAAGNTTAGSFAKLKNTGDELAESFGGPVSQGLAAAAKGVLNFAKLVAVGNVLIAEHLGLITHQEAELKAVAIAENDLTALYTTQAKEVIYLTDAQMERGAQSASATEAEVANQDKLSASAERTAQAMREWKQTELDAHIRNTARAAGDLSTIISGQLGSEMESFKLKQSEARDAIVDTQGRIDELNGKQYLTSAQRQELEDLKTTLGGQKQVYADNATAHEEATARIVFGFVQQRMAADGLQDGEIAALGEIGRAWGIYDEDTANALTAIDDALKNHGTNAHEILNAIGMDVKGLPSYAEFEYKIIWDQASLAALQAQVNALPGESGGTVGGATGDGYDGQAMGGPVVANQPYWVGEHGPELMVPKQSGTVVPSGDAMNMAGGINLNMTINAAPGMDEEALARRVVKQASIELAAKTRAYRAAGMKTSGL